MFTLIRGDGSVIATGTFEACHTWLRATPYARGNRIVPAPTPARPTVATEVSPGVYKVTPKPGESRIEAMRNCVLPSITN